TPQPSLRGAGRPIAVPRQHFLFHNNNKPTSVRPGAPALHPAFGQRSVYMQVYKRAHGAEQPHWPCGPFKIRLPFIHYRWEAAEMLQALIMFVVRLGMIPLLQTYLGLPYGGAVGRVGVCGVGVLPPGLLGVPLAPGRITPGTPVVRLFLGNFEPGPEAMQALFALQLLVFLIFLFLGITRLGTVRVRLIP